MKYMAQIIDGVVSRVVVAESEQWCIDNLGGVWVETIDPYSELPQDFYDGDMPMRRNYAGIGYTFDEGRDVFIPPKPDGDWVFNELSCLWERPEGWIEPDVV